MLTELIICLKVSVYGGFFVKVFTSVSNLVLMLRVNQIGFDGIGTCFEFELENLMKTKHLRFIMYGMGELKPFEI